MYDAHSIRSAATADDGRTTVGALLRDWRTRRRRSQMELALEVGVSPRHLSFIETGRSKPSAAVLVALADGLDVPPRERNRLFLAAGYAPRYTERHLESAAMAHVKSALQRLLDAHQPYPGVALDRHWNVVLANAAAEGLVALVPERLRTPTLNIFRVSLHPDGLAARTVNFAEWGAYLLEKLHRLGDGDDEMLELEREVHAFPNVRALVESDRYKREGAVAQPILLMPCVIELPAGRVSLFTTLTTFGAPRDITLDELCVELFYPSDSASESILRVMTPTSPD
ncbi:MAG: helix-turn-helix domain-containing protein [Caldimonas sp.]